MLISPERYGEGIGAKLIDKEREFAQNNNINVFDIDTHCQERMVKDIYPE
jgi:hypothetical protein